MWGCLVSLSVLVFLQKFKIQNTAACRGCGLFLLSTVYHLLSAPLTPLAASHLPPSQHLVSFSAEITNVSSASAIPSLHSRLVILCCSFPSMPFDLFDSAAGNERWQVFLPILSEWLLKDGRAQKINNRTLKLTSMGKSGGWRQKKIWCGRSQLNR